MLPVLMPLVASYCTTFLKKEMRHIYRQITGLQKFRTFVITDERRNADIYPFDDVEELGSPPRSPLRKVYLKYLRRTAPLIYRGQYQQIISILNRRSPDVFHVYFGHTGVHLLPLLQERLFPTVVSFHGADVILPERRPKYADKMRRLLESVDLVLARSASLAARLREMGCPPEKIRLNYTSIPTDRFPEVQRAFPEDGNWRLLQACRLIQKKGLFTTLEAFARFVKEYPQARLIIAGEGPEEASLKRRIQDLHLEASVDLIGFQSTDQLRVQFQNAHVFLHPSELTRRGDQEGIPNSMLEAMSTGLPVVATRHGGIPEAVTDQGDGLLFPERNPEALAQGLLELAKDSARWASLGRSAAQSVRNRFSIAVQIEALEQCYEEAIRLYHRSAR